jgi:hypothetical protein
MQSYFANMVTLLGSHYESSSEDEAPPAPSKAALATTMAAAPDVSLEVWSQAHVFSIARPY